MKNRNFKWFKRLLLAITAIVAVFAILLGVYVFRVFTHTREAMHTVEEYAQMYPENRIIAVNEDLICIEPESVEKNGAGILFYPGATVAPEAYIPLLSDLADEGFTSYVFRMPCNFASFGKNRAAEVMYGNIAEGTNGIDEWYIGGHSLGGSASSYFVSNHAEDLSGLILISSRTGADISKCGLPVISIYGSKDTVLSKGVNSEKKEFYPEDHTEVVIEGGNHAQMGDYGKQSMDTDADISPEDQRQQTARAILDWYQE